MEMTIDFRIAEGVRACRQWGPVCIYVLDHLNILIVRRMLSGADSSSTAGGIRCGGTVSSLW